MFEDRVVIRGGGDLGSGVGLRLWRCGFPVIILEAEAPLAVRRSVSFSDAVYDGEARVEEAIAQLSAVDEIDDRIARGIIPVVIDPMLSTLEALRPQVLVDAILAKRNTGTRADMARLVIGLGPGFTAGSDVHAVVETNRGADLGRVIWEGSAAANTGRPAPVQGRTDDRVLRSPATGTLETVHQIGDIVEQGAIIASVAGAPVTAAFTSLLRGLAREGLQVTQGMKIGDIDPRLDTELCRRVSDKSLAIAGGVLEVVLSSLYGTRS